MILRLPHKSVSLRISIVDTQLSQQVWVKPPGELPFLYGNHVVKAHLGRITEDTPEHQGVVVYSMADVPLVSLGRLIRSSGIHADSSCRGRALASRHGRR
jgi:ribosome biogenesis protein Nip4